MEIVVAGIAVLAFAATVLVLSGAGRNLQRAPARTVLDPSGDEWMTAAEVAAMLDIVEADLVGLVDREAIPYYLLPGGHRARPSDYRFRRDEIEAWVVG